MDKKITILIFIALLLGAGVLWAYLDFYVWQEEAVVPGDQSSQDVFPDTVVRDDPGAISEGMMQVPLPSSDDTLDVHDVRADSGTVKRQGGKYTEYDFASDVSEISAPFRLIFFETDRAFSILLYELPLSVTRRKAEQEFLARLQISEQEACLLKPSVRTTMDISEEYSGLELGLSFCPGSVVLSES